MATNLTPDDAVQAIHAMTRMLETILARLSDISTDLRAFTIRSERWMRWHFVLLGIILLSSVGMFLVGVRTHAVHNDALRQVMQENRAIFERLQR